MRDMYESNLTRNVKRVLILIILILLAFLAYKFCSNSEVLETFVGSNPITLESLNEIDAEEIEIAQKRGEGYHYYYNQLDDNAKIFYKGIEDNIENIKTGTYQIDYGTYFNDLLNTPNGEEELNKAFQSAWNAFTYDNVDVFYIDVSKVILNIQSTSVASFTKYKVYINNGKNESYLSTELGTTSVEEAETEMKEIRTKIATILQDYNDYEKILYIHDWMIDNIEYDTSYSENNIYNIYGALKNGNAVCEGYSRAFKYILDGIGIPCILISGIATNENGETESHAWNYVKLDEKWYAVDVTWDDPIIISGGNLTNDMRYDNFLRGSEIFFLNHQEQGEISENSMEFKYPEIEVYDHNM